MKPEKKAKHPPTDIRRTHKTKDDFLRWLRERKLLKKQAAEEQRTQADRTIKRALMVWDDDGGSAA